MFNHFRNYISLFRIGLVDLDLLRLARGLKTHRKTYLSYSKLFSLANNFFKVKNQNDAGTQIAEFGVGRGGSALFLAWLINKHGGKLILYDVFSQIPPPTTKDGQAAKERYNQIRNQEDGDDYYGNIPNLLEIILNELGMVCSLDQIEIVQGGYEDTLLNDEKRCFNLVHIDCDWYESTKAVLKFLKNNMHENAIIQFDDYSYWKGSRLAIDETDWLREFKNKSVEEALVIYMGIAKKP